MFLFAAFVGGLDFLRRMACFDTIGRERQYLFKSNAF